MSTLVNLVTDETIKEIIAGIDDFEIPNVLYEVWAIGYTYDEVTSTEILLGSFEDPDAAVQYAAIIQLADIKEAMKEAHLDTSILSELDCLSIEVETVVADEADEDCGTANVGTVYARTIYINNEDIQITSKDYTVMETGELKIRRELLKDFNKNDLVKIMFADQEYKPVLTYKIISTVLYEDGNYYHLEFLY